MPLVATSQKPSVAFQRRPASQGRLPPSPSAHLACCASPRPTPNPAGAQHALSLPELQRRYAHLPPDALRQLLAQLLDRRRSEAPQPAARGLTSLLEGGALRVLSLGPGAPPPPPPPPAWLRPGGPPPSQAHRLLLLRAGGLGVGGSGTHAAGVCPPAEAARALQHHLTVRGHRFAVYCVAYDRCGRFAITGSDDRLVKVCRL